MRNRRQIAIRRVSTKGNIFIHISIKNRVEFFELTLETLCELINSSKVWQVLQDWLVVVVNLLVLLTVFLSVIFTAFTNRAGKFLLRVCRWVGGRGVENIIINLSQLFLVCHASRKPFSQLLSAVNVN